MLLSLECMTFHIYWGRYKAMLAVGSNLLAFSLMSDICKANNMNLSALHLCVQTGKIHVNGDDATVITDLWISVLVFVLYYLWC